MMKKHRKVSLICPPMEDYADMESHSSGSSLQVEPQVNGSRERSPSRDSQKSPKSGMSSKVHRDRRSPNDFMFGKLIGEGSFSSVYLAKDIHTDNEYAVKVCEKQLIVREKKVEQVKREKDVMNLLNSNQNPTAPFFVKLSYAFQDTQKLYFVMTYCKNGELLDLIKKVGNLIDDCSKFYTAEIIRGLEHLHSLNIIHRDLKPENILMDENMHVKITDFGSAKVLTKEEVQGVDSLDGRESKKSFVGTAQYVSPELLESKRVGKESDLWALGCIIYQMVSGLPPFRSRSEYLIFQKILKLDYEFPEGFSRQARDLVEKLLVIESEKRLGSQDKIGYPSLRSHSFFKGLNFDRLHEIKPPEVCPFMPQIEEICWEEHENPGLVQNEMELLLGLDLRDNSLEIKSNDVVQTGKRNMADVSPEDGILRLAAQARNNKWHPFVNNNLILKQGLVDKRKGLFPRRRMFLLTTGPNLYYVDPVNMILKGQVPWSQTMMPEAKNFKTFFVHTPNRRYYLEDPDGSAPSWCQAIEEVKKFYYPDNT